MGAFMSILETGSEYGVLSEIFFNFGKWDTNKKALY